MQPITFDENGNARLAVAASHITGHAIVFNGLSPVVQAKIRQGEIEPVTLFAHDDLKIIEQGEGLRFTVDCCGFDGKDEYSKAVAFALSVDQVLRLHHALGEYLEKLA